MKRFFVLSVVLVVGISGVLTSQTRTPPSVSAGREAQAKEMTSALNLLYVAIQPGFEDHRVIGHFRSGFGARVRTVFVTNGEAGEADGESLYPLQLAGRLRLEAAAAAEAYGGEAYFLNMPDVVAADSASLVVLWPADSLREKLEGNIIEFKPDLIVIGGDRVFGPGLRSSVVTEGVLAASAAAAGRSLAPWKVQRIAYEVTGAEGSVPLRRSAPPSSATYDSLLARSDAAYRSIAVQRPAWFQQTLPLFRVVRPAGFKARSLDAGFPVSVPPRLRGLEQEIRAIGRNYLHGVDAHRQLLHILAVMDSIDLRLIRVRTSEHLERRFLLRWKAGLDDIRNTLLDVKVHYSVSDSILTERQVTFLNITSVQGISDGVTELFVPAVDHGWILNEETEKRVQFTAPAEFRLLSPTNLDFNYPQTEFGLFHSVVRKPWYVFILHKATQRERSFVVRLDLRLQYAPRFLVEVLTPIVNMVPGERIVVRLTNHSRDGVRDSVYINDSIATAPGRLFRLNTKGATQIDTLFPVWKDGLDEGSYLLPVLIDQMPVAKFVARKLSVKVDTTLRVGIIPATANSPLAEALRRIGIRPAVLDSTGEVPLPRSFDAVVIDRRALTLVPETIRRHALEDFVRPGGHLVVLAQEPGAISRFPLLSDLLLKSSFTFDMEFPVRYDSTHQMLRVPNRISEEDFEGWVFLKSHNTVVPKGRFETPVVGGSTDVPMLLTRQEGKGRITYVDLALSYQWMNVHGGALKLLANLLSGHARIGG